MVFFASINNGVQYAESKIVQFYEGQNVLLTGVTGFLGKVVLEKLMRQCPGITTFYLLIRAKKGVSPQKRIEKMLQCPLFEKVLSEQPEIASKIRILEGEIEKINLGLDASSVSEIEKSVTVVIHCAATVGFKETLRSSLLSNVVGTDRVLALCRRMPNLLAMVHVSTAFSNCVFNEICERIYPHDWDPREILHLTEWMSEDMLEVLAPKLMLNYPNPYTYTKAVAEQLVALEAKVLPLIIVRPSIIITTLNEPFPGWVDSLNGPAGLIIALGIGLLQSVRINSIEHRPDMIPCDFVANTIIAAVYKRATSRCSRQEVQIYNSVTGLKNRIKLREFRDLAFPILFDNPPKRMIRYPRIMLTRYELVNQWRLLVYHRIPAWIADRLMVFMGRKPFFSRLLRRVCENIDIVRYFFEREWAFHNDNTRKLHASLNPTDQKLFPMLNDEKSWKEIMQIGYDGGRKHLLKEDSSSGIEGKRNVTRLYWISWASDITIMAIVSYAMLQMLWLLIGIF